MFKWVVQPALRIPFFLSEAVWSPYFSGSTNWISRARRIPKDPTNGRVNEPVLCRGDIGIGPQNSFILRESGFLGGYMMVTKNIALHIIKKLGRVLRDEAAQQMDEQWPWNPDATRTRWGFSTNCKSKLRFCQNAMSLLPSERDPMEISSLRWRYGDLMEICSRHLGREGGEATWKGTTVFHEQPDP